MTGRLSIIIAAGGSSRRYGETDKLTEELDGLPVFLHCIRSFAPLAAPDSLVVTVRQEALENYRDLQKKFLPQIPVRFVPGGATRSESVKNGLAALSGDDGVTAIHDAARPLTSARLLLAVAEKAALCGGAIAASRVVDSVKKVDFPRIEGPLPRESLWLAETPQAFSLSHLRRAYAMLGDKVVTDDAEVMRLAGFPVEVVESGEKNWKLTRPEDLPLLRAFLRTR